MEREEDCFMEQENSPPSSPPRKKSKINCDPYQTTTNSTTSHNKIIIPNTLKHKILAHEDKCNSIQFLKNSHHLISGGKDNAITIWDTTNGTVTRSLNGFKGSVCDIAISPDNNFLVAGMTTHNLSIWDLNSGEIVKNFIGHDQKVCALDISKATGRVIISAAVNYNCLRLWDLQQDKTEHYLCKNAYIYSYCNALCFSQYDTITWSGHANGKIIQTNFDLCWSSTIGEIAVHTQSVTSICSLQNGSVMLTSGRDNLHNMIDARTMKVCGKFKTKGIKVANNWTRTCVSPDENYAAVGSEDGMVSIWSIKMGKMVTSLNGHSGSVLCCAWSSGSGNPLASADSNGTICIWS